MKKTILMALAALCGLPGLAQTEFRSMTCDEAVAAARAEGKMVFMDFYTDWCGPCKIMMRDVFPQKSVGDYMNARFVCIKVNAEKEGKDLARLYNVKAYPTFVVIDTDKEVVLTKVGMAQADDFVAEIDRMLDPDKSPERMKERYDGGERTPGLVAAYAAWMVTDARENRKGEAPVEEAFRMVRDYFRSLDDAGKTAPDNLFIYEKYVVDPSDEMARFMVARRDDFPEASRPVIGQVMADMYRNRLYAYLTGTEPYDAATYEMVKREVNELGYNRDGGYDLIFRLIECHAEGNQDAFVSLCEQVYDRLPEEARASLMCNMSRLITTDDAAVRRHASEFVRSKLAGMEVSQLYFTVGDLMQLEGYGH